MIYLWRHLINFNLSLLTRLIVVSLADVSSPFVQWTRFDPFDIRIDIEQPFDITFENYLRRSRLMRFPSWRYKNLFFCVSDAENVKKLRKWDVWHNFVVKIHFIKCNETNFLNFYTIKFSGLLPGDINFHLWLNWSSENIDDGDYYV